MKKCPQCQSVYTDDTLSYCLNDGMTLIFEGGNSDETLQFPANAVTEAIPVQTESSVRTAPQTEQTIVSQGVSSVWIYSTIGLLSLLLIGGGVGIGFWLNGSNSDIAKNSALNNQSEKVESPKTPTPTSDKREQFQPSPSVQPTLKTSPKESVTPTPTSAETVTPKPPPPPNQDVYRVVGVAGNDVLHLRPSAGNLKVSLAKIPPNSGGLQVVGGGIKVGKAIWYPVIYNGSRGWVNGRFIAKS